MKRVIYIVMLLWFAFNLKAQEYKKWTVSVSQIYGKVQSKTIDRGFVVVPSVAYGFNKNLSLGASFLLPLATEKSEVAIAYTTGCELYLNGHLELFSNFRVSLSAIGMLGTTGAYKSLKAYNDYHWTYVNENSTYFDPYYEDGEVRYQSYRWQIGLRPSVSYHITPNWFFELSYGFLGYRSHKNLCHNYSVNEPLNNRRPRGAWGFNSEMGWGNGLRIGLGYSF